MEIETTEWERVKNAISDLYDKDRDRLVMEGKFDTRIGILEDKRVEDARRRGHVVGLVGIILGAIMGVIGWLIQ